VTPGPRTVRLDDGRTWWRVADLAWDDPVDPTWADRTGGRWNTPGDGPTLYLNADTATARAQVGRMLQGTAIDPEDLRDDAPFVLVPVGLPARQRVADATTDVGLQALGLPRTYPRRARGGEVPWSECRRAARAVRAAHLRGVLSRSAAADHGQELAWFPARGARAEVTGPVQQFGVWRHEPAAADLPG
jgi:RES domain-containing protein